MLSRRLTTGLLSPAERERLFALGADLERAWNAPGVTSATRKRIIRTLIEEIVVRVEDDALSLIIRWQGGDHTALRVRKNRAGQHRWSTDADVVRTRDGAGTSDAGSGDCRRPQPRRQEDGPRQRVDTVARMLASQSPQHCALSRRRAAGARMRSPWMKPPRLSTSVRRRYGA